MKFYIIHDPRFPLRKIFLQAQFKRYDITVYEFVEIPRSGVILSTYIQLLHTISLTKKSISDNTFCIIIDTVLLTRNFLDKVEYGHFINVSSEKPQDVIFIHTTSIHTTKIKKQKRTIHRECWNWDDQTNYSSCFIISPSCAKLFYDYHIHCQDTNEYENINDIYLFKNDKTGLKEQSLISIDKWLFSCALIYSAHSLQILWMS
jgi:hypothetical protein